MESVLGRLAKGDEERREAIHAEIAANGTRWAAEEIDRLRVELAKATRTRRQPERNPARP